MDKIPELKHYGGPITAGILIGLVGRGQRAAVNERN